MNHYEHPDDGAVTRELRACLAELAAPRQPALAAITSRGRAHRRRRAGWVGAGVTGAAVCIALVLGLTGMFGAAAATNHTSASSGSGYTNGTVLVKLGQLFEPAALRRALAHDGVRALVRIGAYCSSSPAVPDSAIDAVVPPGSAAPWPHVRATPRHVPGATRQAAADFHGIYLSANFPVKPSQLAPSVDPVTVVIKSAALRSGTELFIGYFNLGHTVLVDLIYTGSHTCVNRQIMRDAP